VPHAVVARHDSPLGDVRELREGPQTTLDV
jgi:hypothetical protein